MFKTINSFQLYFILNEIYLFWLSSVSGHKKKEAHITSNVKSIKYVYFKQVIVKPYPKTEFYSLKALKIKNNFPLKYFKNSTST